MALSKSPIEIVNESKHQLLTKAKHWKRISLKEIARVQNGYAFSSDGFVKSGGIPLIRIRDIDKQTTVDRFAGVYPVEFIVNNGDILIGMDGDFKAAYWKGEKALLNQRVCRILHNSDIFDRKFLFLCLQPFLNAINEETSSVTVKHLSSKTIQDIPLPFPEINEQRAIVSKIEELFSELDKGIAELKLAQEQLKVYRQSVLKYAFEGRLTNNEVKDGRLPKGWKLNTLTNIVQKNKHSLKAGPFGSSLKKEFYVQSGYKIYGQEQVISGNAFLGDYYINEEKYQELKSCKIEPHDILISLVGTVGKVLILPDNCIEGIINPRLIKISLNTDLYLPVFFKYYFESSKVKAFYSTEAKGTTMSVLNLGIIKTIPFPQPSIEEQNRIIQEIESRLSVADNMEESIKESLQKAEALRQSILKKAFSGELVTRVKTIEIPKIKNEYFHQLQLVALVINGFKKKKIDHGEMTLAKNLYLLDSIYKIPTGFKYDRWHLGPYPPALKKVVNNKEYFKRSELFIEATNDDKLQKYTNSNQDEVNNAIEDLSAIFSKYKGAERSHKTELLATVCKVIEDIKSTDLQSIRQSMAEWKIELKTSHFKNKAEKFNVAETEKCIAFIVEKGWDRKLIEIR